MTTRMSTENVPKSKNPDYIYNKGSDRWVLKSGKIGIKLLKELEAAEAAEAVAGDVEMVETDTDTDIIDTVTTSLKHLDLEPKIEIEQESAKDPDRIASVLNKMVNDGLLFTYQHGDDLIYTFKH